MNTLLIVEDNDFERNALQHYVDWDVLGITVVDAAYNGKDGLEKTKRHRPDIILSDVKMPEMDGIEMAKAVMQIHPGVKFIFSSGHDDVGLLREAMDVRAYDYLVKPLRQEELIGALRKIVAAATDEKLSRRASQKMIDRFQHNLQHLRAKFLEELMAGSLTQEEAGLIYARAGDLELYMTGFYRLAMIELEFAGSAGRLESAGWMNELSAGLQEACGPNNVLFVKDGDNRLVAVLHSLKDGPDAGEAIVRSIEAEVAALAGKHAFRYVIGISGCAPNPTDLSELYRQCRQTLNGKVGSGYGRILPYEQVRERAEDVSRTDNGRIERLLDEIAAGVCEGLSCEDVVEDLMNLLTAEPELRLERVQSVVIRLFGRVANGLEQAGGSARMMAEDETDLYQGVITARTVPDLAAYTGETVRRASSHMARRKGSKEDYIVREILDILNAEFCRPITLAYLSERVYLSPNYLRILFKEKMNVSIQTYLTGLRMDKAKELLRQNRYKIHEIGAMVGYENSTYFNFAFKNSVHMTPGEYRSKHMNQVSGA